MNNFSIIIPTIWMSEKIQCLLEELGNSNLINEIILINNDVKRTPEINLTSQKIIHIKNEKNIFVNPSWNLGVNLCKNNNIIISNDDLCIKDIDRIINKIIQTNFDLIGLDYLNLNKSEEVIIEEKTGGMTKGFGCFFFIKKENYINIPEDIKIWYGDLILHNSIKNKGKISFNGIDIELSKSVKNTPNLLEILNMDKELYERKFTN